MFQGAMRALLIVSNKRDVIQTIRLCHKSDHRIDEAYDKDTALKMLKERRYEIVFIDIEILMKSIPPGDYWEALRPFRQTYPTLQIVILSHQGKIRETLMAVKAGANSYLTYPFHIDEVKHVIESIHEAEVFQPELDYMHNIFWKKDYRDIIQTESPLMKTVYKKAMAVAPTRSTVLLLGETGTGKGVLTNLICTHSNRKDEQFISLHCGAIPDTLLESELFGHEKGAFTGAYKRKIGKFEIANKGTIFLDEIGTMTPSAQIKLLQVLQEGIFQRVGGETVLKTDVRVIAATNNDMKKMCDDGLFRKDLYYRLNVFPIEIPPLRNRIEDIPHLVNTYLKKMNTLNSKEIMGIDPLVLEAFAKYPWPGNIRELENIIERAYILETSSVLTPESFPGELFESNAPLTRFVADSSLSLVEVRRRSIEYAERRYIQELLAVNNGRIKESSEAAGISTRYLNKLMTKYGIKKEMFRSHCTVSKKTEY
ncbi:MAG: sigma-54 dependent transcriptional regulator [Thermodesulfobacteriota bacterium]|nr:sigma-54 dependent transcriptional regulator [Thermodesulfobacteriota bacterium]